MNSNKIFIQSASYKDNQLLTAIKDCLKNSNHKDNLVFCIACPHCIKDIWDTVDESKDEIQSKIFIQIAAYRDNQLLPTIKDCIKNAHYPDNLVFCIAWQHSIEDTWDTLDEYKNDPRFKIIDIDYKDSQGVCWARNKIQQYYDNEEYTLQLDSHHRFVPDWDLEVISMIKNLQAQGYLKPLLTSYLPSFNPMNDPEERQLDPWKLNFDRYIPEGTIFFLPAKIDNHKSLELPIPSRFYSAHFCFTLGSFCKEVQHDPDLYFHGEEISISARAYTWGYDLFSPHKVIAWHEYTRSYRKKHWDDCCDWNQRNKLSHARLRKLFGIDGITNDIDFGKYGFGTIRSLSDYEKYAGLCFKTRGIQQYTLDHKLPPNPEISDPAEYEKSFIHVFRHCIDIHEQYVPYDDYTFWAVIFEDRDGNSIYRQDVTKDDLKTLKDVKDNFYKIWRTFNYTVRPYKYIVWPFSEKHGWCTKIEDVIYKTT
jgi:glycosyltransferase involved in cell wall biosynthesis